MLGINEFSVSHKFDKKSLQAWMKKNMTTLLLGQDPGHSLHQLTRHKVEFLPILNQILLEDLHLTLPKVPWVLDLRKGGGLN
jgi:hypothetical protein